MSEDSDDARRELALEGARRRDRPRSLGRRTTPTIPHIGWLTLRRRSSPPIVSVIRPATKSTSGTIATLATIAGESVGHLGRFARGRRLDHHPHQRLGAARAHSTRPRPPSARLGLPDLVGHERRHHRRRAGHPHVDAAPAGSASSPTGQLGERSARARASTSSSASPVSMPSPVWRGRGRSRARLLAAERRVAPRRAPRARSGRRPASRRPRCRRRASRAGSPRLRHHGDDDGVVARGGRGPARSSAQMAMIWSPSTIAPVCVDGDHPVGVAVEGEPDVGAVGDAPPRCSASGCVRAAAVVDVAAVGLGVDHDRRRRRAARSAVGRDGATRRRWRSRRRRAGRRGARPSSARDEVLDVASARHGVDRRRRRRRSRPGRPTGRQHRVELAPRSPPRRRRRACARRRRRA